MPRLYTRLMVLMLVFMLLFLYGSLAQAMIKGIYITQETLEDTQYINYLINRAKKVGIRIFVVDIELPSSQYQKNIKLLLKNNIAYTARVIIFPNNGGKPSEVKSQA